MKNILIIPDKFKESLSSAEIIDLCVKALDEEYDNVNTFSYLISDGGDGFLDAIAHNKEEAIRIPVDSVNALGEPIQSEILVQGSTAFIEVAKSSGLQQIPLKNRRPVHSSSYGTGLELKKAIDLGAKQIYIGLGGSATNDGGIGMLGALGFQFLDLNDKPLSPIAANLIHIERIVVKEFPGIQFYGICDVENPLLGKSGATSVYGPQKGLNKYEIIALENGLNKLNQVSENQLIASDQKTEIGAGAAGGIGYGLLTFLNAKLIKGGEFMIELNALDELANNVNIDLVITGEGHFDAQSLQGKWVSHVINFCKRHKLSLLGFFGKISIDIDDFDHAYEIANSNWELERNMSQASDLLSLALKKALKNFS